MKDFNIDQLPKKTPYKTPVDFFSEVQENVWKKTVLKPRNKTRMVKMRTVLTFAAVLVLFAGLSIVWKYTENGSSNHKRPDRQTIAKTNTTREDLTSSEQKHQTAKPITTTKKREEESVVKNTSEAQQPIMASLLEEELSAFMAEHTEDDPYLEL